MTPERYLYITGLITDTWNALAKENGWPKRVSVDDVRHMRPLITNTEKGLEVLNKFGRTEDTLLRWVLSRWNWQKSPAPITQAGVMTLWQNLRDSLALEAEEAAQDIQKQLEEVENWVKFRVDQAIKQGLSLKDAIKRVEDYAVASGKIDGWNQRERIRFQETLEKTLEPNQT